MGEQPGDLADPTPFEVGKHQVDQAVVLTVSGEVDMLSSPMLAEAIQTALAAKPAALIVDLSKVGFLASAGMTVLVTTQAELQPPTKFAVVADGSATSRPIKLMGIDSVLSLYPSLNDALSALSGA
ncbi:MULTISPECIES: STAS domain-containing protein [Mycobacterium avium complex (MAC)]|jgi:anti-anti-sigma factor|uniref:Anti-sigma factor antagonist n=5 Tax=Mycobacterium avium complex (MAC) TaxID=120793 RepID=A0A2A3L7Y1_MYCAV|nr:MULTISPECIES: STAS domain-containing protein [Mycobacterium avium complex (MAC)]ELP44075.1 anti-anti-sigma factor [Mycobacterium avium subsp. paratuberculosis S5]ETA93907.1 anti-anti-sigma factor [Mycobacterium avium subsp. paratuberculosis 10-4404]ETA95902.1 anti-anti-sigma factor [Mycobacterium avium 05-4293]ETB01261.1 anti-anti-sigma factor [Mycobacterium avium 10-5581]ETB03363.1 anti-anti-sigma factor [Mycobacterium avium subsp. silvaticum ATCC 49884]ETB08230.1 anti-anti-sigma factor [